MTERADHRGNPGLTFETFGRVPHASHRETTAAVLHDLGSKMNVGTGEQLRVFGIRILDLKRRVYRRVCFANPVQSFSARLSSMETIGYFFTCAP